MNNPTIDNDLQKAIDDITKITDDDPIFADPIAPAPVETPAPKAPVMPMHDIVPPVSARPVAPAPVTPAPVAPAPAPVSAPAPAPMPKPLDEEIVTAEETVEEVAMPQEEVKPFMASEGEKLNKDQVKEAALRDLAPILGKLDIPSEKKFDIYKTVIDDYNDSSVIAPAYQTATDIKDDKERAEALLYLIESIDKM